MNVLVTAIGSFSASAIIKSLRKDIRIKNIFGCDIYPKEWHNISKEFDEVFLAPKVIEEDKYFNFIIDICRKNNIKIIIPLTDIEVDFFNKHRNYFKHNNIILTIANPVFLEVARNKQKLNEYSKKIKGLNVIKTYSFKELNSNIHFPLIAKPINGRSSEGIFIVNSLNHVKNNTTLNNYIFQEIKEGKICTVDYVRSSKFKTEFCMPRWEYIRTKNGAGITVEIFYSKSLENIVKQIGNDLDINGCVNIEFIYDGDKYYIIDINPRFSAGIAFSKLAGYDFVKSRINAFTGEDILPTIKYNNMIAEKVISEVINIIFSE